MKIRRPSSGFCNRMGIYLAEMYPIPTRTVNAILLYISFMAVLCRIHAVPFSFSSPFAFTGCFSLFAIMLILRMMDELKDRQIDQSLFSKRPLPSGRVLESDLSFSLFIVMILYLLVNIWTAKIFWMALFALTYTLLMFKYFFIPGLLRKHLLLNLATHNPIIPILLFYLLVLFNTEHNLSFNDLDWRHSLLLIFLYWLLFFSWEIARKIRCMEEENAYVTYSQIFGRLGAIFIAGGAQTAVLLIALYIYYTFMLSFIFIIIILPAYALTIFGHLRFIYKPNVKHRNLRSFAEFYILSCFLAVVSELIIFLLVRNFDYAP